MEKNANTFFYGSDVRDGRVGNNNWLPSTSLYPQPRITGHIYIAGDSGTITEDNESYVTGEAIVFQENKWKRLGISGFGGGNPIEQKTIFITEITAPTGSAIGNEIFQGGELKSVTGDTQSFTIKIRVIPSPILEPVVTYKIGNSANVTVPQSSFNLENGFQVANVSLTIPDQSFTTITFFSQNGGSSNLEYTLAEKPQIVGLKLSDGTDYPEALNGQTAMNGSENVNITLFTDEQINEYKLESDATDGDLFENTNFINSNLNLINVDSNGIYEYEISILNIKNSNFRLEKFFSLRVKNSFGSISEIKSSRAFGSDDKIQKLFVDSSLPSASIDVPESNYPVNQLAIKLSEQIDINFNYDPAIVTGVEFSSDQLNILGSSTLLESNKTVERNQLINEAYNVSTSNIFATFFKASNNTDNTTSGLVRIVNVAAEIEVKVKLNNSIVSAARSGGQNHTVEISSNQFLKSAEIQSENNLDKGDLSVGSWIGVNELNSLGVYSTWRKTFIIPDDHLKGTWNFQNPLYIGLSNIPSSLPPINGTTYTLKGFFSREINLGPGTSGVSPASVNIADLGVTITDSNNLNVISPSLSGTTWNYENNITPAGSTQPPIASFTILEQSASNYLSFGAISNSDVFVQNNNSPFINISGGNSIFVTGTPFSITSPYIVTIEETI